MISVENCSPFPYLVFEKTGPRGQPFDVIVVGGTFDIVHSSPLVVANRQLPLLFADEYHGDPSSTSLRAEGDLVITKPGADVHVVGHARAPGLTPRPDWLASVRVGPVAKRLRVTGPRWWKHSARDGWRLSAPEPCTEVPLTYEMAYGGTVTRHHSDGTDESVPYVPNPVGRGWFGGEPLDPARRHPAPQIESWENPVRELDAEYPPEGFGPISRWWSPRLARAGTYDARWESERFPDYPDDFDLAFYNSAHPELICPRYLTAGEAVSLVGLFPEGPVDTTLPWLTVVAILGDAMGYVQPEEMRLDTVTFDTDARTARLVWRRTVPRDWELSSVVLGAIPTGPSRTAGARALSSISR